MISRALKDYRRAHGLKQDVLAERLGVAQPTLSRWESGTARPSLAQRRRIADLVGAPQGLSPSGQMMVQTWLDPHPATLSSGPAIVWNVCNPAARAKLYGPFLNHLQQEVLPELHPLRQAMFRDCYDRALKGEIVGAECMNPFRTEPGDSGSSFYSYGHLVFSVCDGLVYMLSRDRLVPAADFERGGARLGYRYTTLDEILSEAAREYF